MEIKKDKKGNQREVTESHRVDSVSQPGPKSQKLTEEIYKKKHTHNEEDRV